MLIEQNPLDMSETDQGNSDLIGLRWSPGVGTSQVILVLEGRKSGSQLGWHPGSLKGREQHLAGVRKRLAGY